MEQFQQDQLSDLKLQVDSEVRQHLNSSAKWSKFISVTVFIFSGLVLLIAVGGSTAIIAAMEKMSGRNLGFITSNYLWVIMGTMVFALAVFVFIYYFLFNFAAKIRSALMSEDVDVLNRGLGSLKSYFIITTVFSILMLLINIYNLFK